MLVVGVTGGIASGKSTAVDTLAALGAPVVRADGLARRVVEPGQPAHREIAAAFPGVLRADGTLDRGALGRRIFADPEARRRLEEITHPPIRALLLEWLGERRKQGAAAVVCDIPLLFEAGYHLPGGPLDRIWVVSLGPEEQLRRVMLRDGLDATAARQRLAAQWPLAEKAALADLVLNNSGSPAELERQVRAAWAAVRAEVCG